MRLIPRAVILSFYISVSHTHTLSSIFFSLCLNLCHRLHFNKSPSEIKEQQETTNNFKNVKFIKRIYYIAIKHISMSNRTYLYMLRYYWSEPCTLSPAQYSDPTPSVYPVCGSTLQHPFYTAVTGSTVVKPDHISATLLLWNLLKWNSCSTTQNQDWSNNMPFLIKWRTQKAVRIFQLDGTLM